MAKKPKKAKTPKVKGGGKAGKGGGKDPVTGLYLEFYLDDPNKRVRFDNDRTYSPEEVSQIETSIGFPRDTDRIQREFELSDRFLVQTNHTSYEDGSSAVERQVYFGQFTFNKGRLQSATIFSVADEIVNFQDGRLQARQGFINNAIGSQRLSDATSYRAWLDLNFSRQYSPQARYGYDELDSKFYEGSTFDRDALARFGEGRFFQEGWWLDPFTPNLI